MKWTMTDPATHTYVIVGEPGEEAFGLLTEFALAQNVTAAGLTAVGAFSEATVGWFDREAREYRRIEIEEQCEVLSLVGDVAVGPEGPEVHAHAVLGLWDGSVRGGHLLSALVWPTLEVIVRETPTVLRKTVRPEVGLALIDLPGGEVQRTPPWGSAAVDSYGVSPTYRGEA